MKAISSTLLVSSKRPPSRSSVIITQKIISVFMVVSCALIVDYDINHGVCFVVITYLNVVRKCDCSCTDQDQQYEVERDGDGVGKQEQRFFHPPS